MASVKEILDFNRIKTEILNKVRSETLEERRIFLKTLIKKLKILRTWKIRSSHDAYKLFKRLGILKMTSSLPTFTKRTIQLHLSRTKSVMDNPCEATYLKGLELMKKIPNIMWEREKRYVTRSIWNIWVLMFCQRFMSKFEEHVERAVQQYRAQNEYWPAFVKPKYSEGPHLIEIVNFHKKESQINTYMDHLKYLSPRSGVFIRRSGYTINLFSDHAFEWREDVGGQFFKDLQREYSQYLNAIAQMSMIILPKSPPRRIIRKINLLQSLFRKRFKNVLAGWPSALEEILLCPYCNFLRIVNR